MYRAKIICDSVSPLGKRLTTLEITFPRTALSELRTHRQIHEDDEVEMFLRGTDGAGRALSMNSASSRAIPVDRMIQQVMDDPYIPEFTGAQKGMQGAINQDTQWQLRQAHRVEVMRNVIVPIVRDMLNDGVHKQDANRYLEPLLWHTVILTATEWSNYFAQRTDGMAYPPLHKIACMMQELYNANEPSLVQYNEYHLPYIQDDERRMDTKILTAISSARCARVSYLNQDGNRNVIEDMKLYERLRSGMHMSPFEHVATPSRTVMEKSGNFIGWKQFRKGIKGECR